MSPERRSEDVPLPIVAERITEDETVIRLLAPQVGALAIKRHDFFALVAARSLGEKRRYSEVEEGLLAWITDDDLDCSANKAHYYYPVAKASLQSTYQDIAVTLRDYPEAHQDGVVNWASMAFGLLEGASHIEATEDNAQELHRQMQTAFACSLMADSLETRRHFLEAVYQLGMNTTMAQVLRESELSYVDNSPRRESYRFSLFADAFGAPTETLDYYFRLIDSDEVPGFGMNPRKLQAALARAFTDGIVDEELIELARGASLPPDFRQTLIFDPNKILRFALQEWYMRQQLPELFDGETVQDSPFAKGLAQRRDEQKANTFMALRGDIEETVRELFTPIRELYALPKSHEETTELDIRKRAALLFRQSVHETLHLGWISNYIGMTKHSSRIPYAREIWSVPNLGAAAPRLAASMLANMHSAAHQYWQETGDRPTAEELYQLALTRRKFLMRVAMSDLADFRALEDDGYLDGVMVSGAPPETIGRLGRGEDGSLDPVIPLAEVPVRNIATGYEGNLLGCPGGRIASATMDHSRRLGAATNNLIDYIVEAAIHEAYQRGLFELY